MIELIATGPVSVVDDHDVNRQDGHDTIHGTVRTVSTLEVTVDLEFDQGHVNLEGYAPSAPGIDWALGESIGSYVDEAVGTNSYAGLKMPKGQWDVELAGEWWDWIQQAHRYQTERPGKSIVDCLEQFRGWDETSDDRLNLAIDEARAATSLSAVAMGDLTDRDYERLADELQQHHRYLLGSIKMSYSQKRPA